MVVMAEPDQPIYMISYQSQYMRDYLVAPVVVAPVDRVVDQ